MWYREKSWYSYLPTRNTVRCGEKTLPGQQGSYSIEASLPEKVKELILATSPVFLNGTEYLVIKASG